MAQIHESNRVFLTKLEGGCCWEIISNPRVDNFSKAMNAILANFANNYAEYKNCGVLHRMVRFEDIELYGIKKSKVNSKNSIEVDSFKSNQTKGV